MGNVSWSGHEKAGGSMKKKIGKKIKRVSPSELNRDEARSDSVRQTQWEAVS
jgi:hypothetical protein